MDQPVALDIHCHLVPLTPARTAGLNGIHWRGDALDIDGYVLASPSVYRAEALIEWMDKQRVARAWISIPPPLYRLSLDADEAARWTACMNDALHDVAQRYPDRLQPMFHLPVQHPALAAATVQHWRERAAALFAMPAGSAEHQVMLSDDGYEPLWQALNAARAFLFLHPCKGCDGRYDRFYLHNLLGSPVETALAAAHLALSGVLDRHPDFTLCLAHGGGATAAVAGRLERGQITGRPGADTGARRPRDVFRHVCVDCITHDPSALVLAAAMHGDDHVFFGSDWPFSMGLPVPHEQLAEVSSALIERIFSTNAAALLDKYR